MASISAERLVTHGLFPENLPSVFTTRNIWANLAPGSTTYAVTARAVGEICPYDASKRGGQRRVFGDRLRDRQSAYPVALIPKFR